MAYEIVELIIDKHVDDIITLTKPHHAEGYPHLDYDEEYIRSFAHMIRNDMDRETMNVFLCYKDHEAIGYCFCTTGRYSFAPQRFSTLELIYISPPYRGSRAYLKLVRAYEEWARLRGCIEFWAGVGIEDEAKAEKISNALVKIGYQRMGFTQRKKVK